MSSKNIKACFMGLGYIGLPTAIIAAHNGISVVGVDVNAKIINTISQEKLHISEPGLKEIAREVIRKKCFYASITPEESDVYLIVVPTPFKNDCKPDISFVIAATKSVIPLLKKGDLYIIESTSPVGTTEKMAELIFTYRPELRNKIYIAYCPERVLPGNVIYELVHNDRIIGGINKDSADAACNFYKAFVKGELHTTNARTAEMCKLVENSSRDVQIAFANELSMICDKADIDVWDLIKLANKHPRVNILLPGSGVGGHCIAVDPWFIVSHFPKESNLIEQARKINNYKALWCFEKIHNEILKYKLEHGSEPRVALMGLAFKPNVSDLRESPAKYIVQKIAQKVVQNSSSNKLMVVEPNIENHQIFKLTNYKKAYKEANIIAFLIAHKEFKTLQKRADKVILDFCGVFKQQQDDKAAGEEQKSKERHKIK